MTLPVLALVLLCLAGLAQPQNDTATFYGGQRTLQLNTASRTLDASLRFMPLQPTGVVLIATGGEEEGGGGYLLVGLLRGELIVNLRYPQAASVEAPPSSSFRLETSVWHSLSLQLNETLLSVAVDGHNTLLADVTPAGLGFTQVHVAGAPDFLAPLFVDLNVTQYFSGCIANVSVNGRTVDSANDDEYGMESGCCPNPKPIYWCFESLESTYVFRTHESYIRDSEDIFSVSFGIIAHQSGVVLLSHGPSTAFAVELHNRSLAVVITSDSDEWRLECQKTITNSSWHFVSIVVRSMVLSCEVDATSNDHIFITLEKPPELLVSVQVGSALLNASLPPGFSSQLSTPALGGGRLASFGGCLRTVMLNGAALSARDQTEENSPTVSGVCSSEEIPEHPETNCSGLSDVQLSVTTSPVAVNEGGWATITTTNIALRFDSSSSNSLLFDSLQFSLVAPPTLGYLSTGGNRRISQFSYRELSTGQLLYHHLGAEDALSDFIHLEVGIECDPVVVSATVNASLEVSISLFNDNPYVLSLSDLSIAIGTRRVIGPGVITVADSETSDPSEILFNVLSISGTDANCSSECASGRIEKTHQLSQEAQFFSQHEINVGNISFQHFEQSGPSSVLIRLRVQDSSVLVGSMDVSINVLPRQGSITLEREGDCIFVVEGRDSLLTDSDLLATTDFEDQNPVVTYHILLLPSSGKVQRRDRINSQLHWVTLDGSETHNSFTQANIDRGEVRYFHDNTTDSFSMADGFQFQIQSTNFSGPIGSLCFHVVLMEQLIQPELVIENPSPVEVDEGGSVTLTEDTLVVSSFVDVDTLGVFLTVTSLPLHGQLLLDGAPLEDSNFTLAALQAQRMAYQHDGTEEPQDSFTVFAEAATIGRQPIQHPNRTDDLEVFLSISPVNDNAPGFGSPPSPIRLSEGMCMELTHAMIPLTDADLPDDSLGVFVRAVRSSDPPIGHFAFISNKLEAIRRFSLRNITESKVVFCNTLDENADLNYSHRLRIDDNGGHIFKTEVLIEVVPLLLTVVLSPPGSDCLGTVDALQAENNAFTLAETSFDISLLDLHGNDPGRLLDINISVSVPPSFGELRRSQNGSSSPVSYFSCIDVRNQRIQYIFWNQSGVRQDNFSLRFQYGHRSFELPVQACILPVPTPDAVRVLQGLTVAQGGVAVISTGHISANDSRGEHNVFFNITAPPLYGSVLNMNLNQAVSAFSYEELADGAISYMHTALEQIRDDSVRFKVCTEFGCSEEYTLSVGLFVDGLVVINTGCTVREGGRCEFNSSVLHAVAPAGHTITFFFDRHPMHGDIVSTAGGRITINPTNIAQTHLEQRKVFYNHSGGEDLFDDFLFTVTAEMGLGDVKTTSQIFNITVLPENDHSPEIVNLATEIIAVRGARRYFTTEFLSAYDQDSYPPNEDLRYLTHGFPLRGTMHLTGSSDPVDSWLERDIQQGRLYYIPEDQMVDQDILVVSVTDGERESRREHTQIRIRDIIFRFIAPLKFSIEEGETSRITEQYLRYDAENDNTLVDSEFRYTITQLPAYGILIFDGINVVVNMSFTQEDIVNRNLLYAHDHSNTERDFFSFSLSVPVHQTAGQNYRFEVEVRPVDDDPPTVTHIKTPIFVVELGKTMISSDDIVIQDTDSVDEIDFEAIVCTVVDGPHNGIIQRARFNGSFLTTHEFTKFDLDENAVIYSHTSADSETDSFMFNISDRYNRQKTTYTVAIVVLPEVVPLTVTNQLYVREGGQVAIGRGDINSTHHYLTGVLGKIAVKRRPNHGILINTVTNQTDVEDFTTVDLQLRAIRYVHNGDESITDDFQFEYTSCEPSDYPRMSDPHTLSFDIDPVNDEPPMLFPSRKTVLNLWVNEVVTLNQTYFNTSDADTEPQLLNYTFSPYVGSYYIAFADTPRDSISWFTQADVNTGRVLFVHESDLSPRFGYNVTDGHQVVTGGLLSVFATKLMLWCNQADWLSLTVERGANISISSTSLGCITNDMQFREIQYSFDPPLYGRVMAGGNEATVFTHTQLNSGELQYVHTDLDQFAASEELTISVSTPLADTITVELPIAIVYPSSPNSILAIKAPLELQEGGVDCLTVDNLDARNVRYNSWREAGIAVPVQQLGIQFMFETLPQYGYFTLSGLEIWSAPLYFMQEAVLNGSLCYHHDGSETTNDTLPFVLSIVDSTATVLRSTVEDLPIIISPVNDHEPVLITTAPNITLVLGFPYVLISDDLLVTDSDEPDTVTYTVSLLPLNAEIVLDGRVLQAESSGFTQEDINTGLVQLNPLSLQDGSFVFSYSDGPYVSGDVQFDIRVEDLTLSLVSNESVTYRQNLEGAAITPEILDTATNGLRGETWFVVVRPPHGTIVGPSNSSNFSQTEIDSHMVRYRAPPHHDSSRDGFVVDIHNRNVTISGVELSIKSAVLGSVKQDTHLDLSSSYSLPLPVQLFQLDALQSQSGAPPTMDVIEKPRYGFLETKIVQDGVVIGKRSAASGFTFRYDSLELGWVFYTWDYAGPALTSPTVEDSFTVLVRANGVQPGEAVVRLTITPPTTTIEPPSTPHSSQQPATTKLPGGTPSPSNDEGFPLYTLIPILGVFGILILIMAIVIVFYYSQRSKFRKKLQPSVTSRASRQQQQQQWSPGAAPHALALTRAGLPQNYEFEGTLPSEDEEEMSDAFSQYSEEIIAQNHSPTIIHSDFMFSQQRSSPAHSHPPFSLPPPSSSSMSHSRAAGVRSNISIAFSHRDSVPSATGMMEDPTYFSLPRPVNMAAPIPVRPSSHTEFRPHQGGKSESGYNSTITRTAETSAFSSRSPSRDDQQHEEQHFPSADIDLPFDSHLDEGICAQEEEAGDSPNPDSSEVRSSAHALASLKLNSLNGSSGLLELADPELLQMKSFPPPNPVLKSQEFWV